MVLYLVYIPYFCWGGGRGWGGGGGGGGPPVVSFLPNFEKGGLDRISIFRGGCREKGGDFFRGSEGGVAVFT